MTDEGPHATGAIAAAGPPLSRAGTVFLMAHGRGADASDMLVLAGQLGDARTAALAPQALGHSWWPESFLAPLKRNAPGLLSGLAVFENLLAQATASGVPHERTVLVGFSQGACLVLEFAARHPGRFGAVLGLSGGLLGTADGTGSPLDALYGYSEKRFDYAGDMAGTPVLLACHARDPHIPLARVETTAETFERLGAHVTTHIDPGVGHGVTAETLALARKIVGGVAAPV